MAGLGTQQLRLRRRRYMLNIVPKRDKIVVITAVV